jgi:hypothetical protein
MDAGFDSYTGVPIQKYESQIPNIGKGRSPFYKEAELQRISAQYYIGPHEGGSVAEPSVAAESVPAPRSWYLRREGCPAEFFPALRSSAVAHAVMDWCVRNDASVRIVIHWLTEGNIEPYFNLLDRVAEIADVVDRARS